jgi:hypothetical protein
MIAKPSTSCRATSLAVITFLLLMRPAGAQELRDPDLMDPLGRYELRLPDGWRVVGTNSKLNGFVIGDGEESFVAVYHDGTISPDQVIPTLTALCACPVPKDPTVEVLSDAAYPAQVIQIGHDDQGSVVAGTVLFPRGMFGVVSIFKNEQTRVALKDVLRQARPGPSRRH